MTTTDARLREACVQFEKLLEREATYQHWTAYSGLDALKKVLKWWHEDRPWGVHAALARAPVGVMHPEKLVDEFDSAVTAYGNLDCDKTNTPDGKAKLERYESARLALISALKASQPRVLVDVVIQPHQIYTPDVGVDCSNRTDKPVRVIVRKA